MMRPEDVPPGHPVVKDHDGKFWFPTDLSLVVGHQIKVPMGDGWIVESERTEATIRIGWWTGKKWKEQVFPRALVKAWKENPPPSRC